VNHAPNPHLCPHGQNKKTCIACYHEARNAPPVAKKEVPSLIYQKPGMPQGYVIPIGEALLRTTQGADARQRSAAAVASIKMEDGSNPREPVQTASRVAPPEAFSPDKLWKPKAHRSLIDSQPKHPHANEGKTTVLK
jgi:hypothetical protein